MCVQVGGLLFRGTFFAQKETPEHLGPTENVKIHITTNHTHTTSSHHAHSPCLPQQREVAVIEQPTERLVHHPTLENAASHYHRAYGRRSAPLAAERRQPACGMGQPARHTPRIGSRIVGPGLAKQVHTCREADSITDPARPRRRPRRQP